MVYLRHQSKTPIMVCRQPIQRSPGTVSAGKVKTVEKNQQESEESCGRSLKIPVPNSSLNECWLLMGQKKTSVLFCPIGTHLIYSTYYSSQQTATPTNFLQPSRVTFLMLQVCLKSITWYIEMHHVIGLKQTRGIKNVALKAAKKFVGVAVYWDE